MTNRLFLLLSLCFLFCTSAVASTSLLTGQWHYVDKDVEASFLCNPLDAKQLNTIDSVPLTGGHIAFVSAFTVDDNIRQVLDFKNTGSIGRFKHSIYDQKNRLVFQAHGGTQSSEHNPFFLRHGRDIHLAPGTYTLVSEIISPYLIGTPEPFISELKAYQKNIKLGNAITLMCFGIFFGLGVYYAFLFAFRGHTTDFLYSIFILCNLLYSSSALLTFNDVFGVHFFYLGSFPILFSNIAYIFFVNALLNININTNPVLYRLGMTCVVILAASVPFAFIWPNYSMEIARHGVSVFLTYGLVCAIIQTIKGNKIAPRYLFAISAFFILGILAITLDTTSEHSNLFVEHVGTIAITFEVVLLALVLSYQVAKLKEDNVKAYSTLEKAQEVANMDALTKIPNRRAFMQAVQELPQEGSLSIVDLDNLKYYNDHFGHQHGDRLLSQFVETFSNHLIDNSQLFRLGGDEFAILSPVGDVSALKGCLHDAAVEMKQHGFDDFSASMGMAFSSEINDVSQLIHLADMRMYESKRANKNALAIYE